MPPQASTTPLQSPRSKTLRRNPPNALRDLMREEQKRSFLRMVSHELRTPLNSIIGFSEIISRELYGALNEPRYREHAEIIRDSGLKMLKLVNQVLEIARLEGDSADLDLRCESAEAAVDEAIRALREEISTRGCRIRIETTGAHMVCADARALHTILVNLLQNAMTYSPVDEEIVVRVRQRPTTVVIEVEDRGDGVPAADLARILRPFEQGENALTRRSEGAGLGLPIVRLLCRAMHGTFRLRTVPDGGLLASVTLPAADAA
jgi:signal transduction histidine kinase